MNNKVLNKVFDKVIMTFNVIDKNELHNIFNASEFFTIIKNIENLPTYKLNKEQGFIQDGYILYINYPYEELQNKNSLYECSLYKCTLHEDSIIFICKKEYNYSLLTDKIIIEVNH